ncbi:hypothetical protein TrCOL_g11549 [Triparma columacea]|uniref:Bifunctional polynucleotide phosphatase/kinase n=1 Tax=Triparma columacea TaxID=722753 RepID=A0A9W7L9L4_9STRA|nr:hypothetical protein TrCOL_g11549 [Triparma columacea]
MHLGETALVLDQGILEPQPVSDGDSDSDSDYEEVSVTRYKVQLSSGVTGWVSASSRIAEDMYDITRVVPKPTWTYHPREEVMERTDPRMMGEGSPSGGEKIAAFDLDGTLEVTKLGTPPYLATSTSEFRPYSDSVISKVRELHADGYRVVIFSNQGGVGGKLDGCKADVVRGRVDFLGGVWGVPFAALFATGRKGKKGEDETGEITYRKPGSGMWEMFLSKHNKGVKPDLKVSFYVGDAAGRMGDHGDCDREFARSVGVKFYTPEQFFGREGS